MNRKDIVWLAAAAALTANAASAQTQDPAWIDELRSQLVLEQQCDAAYFLNLQEFESQAGVQQKARVQCEDGRMFDAERVGTTSDFTITSCGRQVCGLDEKTDTNDT